VAINRRIEVSVHKLSFLMTTHYNTTMNGHKKEKKKKEMETVSSVVSTVAEEKIMDEGGAVAKAERKKRKKEAKRAAAESNTSSSSSSSSSADEGIEGPVKRARKEHASSIPSTNGNETNGVDVDGSGEEATVAALEAKKKRKAERRERRRLEAEAEANANANANAENHHSADKDGKEEIKTKKDKKKKEANGHSDNVSSPSLTISSSSSTVPTAVDGYSTGPKHFRRCFYTEHAEVKAMTTEEVAALRSQLKVTIHSPITDSGASKKSSKRSESVGSIRAEDDIRPLATFAQSGLPAHILKCVSGFSTPTAIQAQCWPAILSGRDVIGIAETGSGKTLGFILPALVHILDQPAIGSGDRAGPICLVLAPTRELAMQINEVAKSSGAPCGIRSVCIYGGADKYAQKQELRHKGGVHIVAATPGRLLGLIEERALSLKRVTYLVLDEADRMLDLGFEPDIRRIVGEVGAERQTLLFSATWPTSIQALGREFVVNPFHITIGNAGGEQLAANHRVKQEIEVIDEWKREARLLELLKKYHSSRENRVLIFVLYKKEVDRIERHLAKNGWKASGISGDKNQFDRTAALAAFKDGSKPLLIATDVAARGLDIPQVEVVINYSFPLTIEDYVHRIGRTGRGGANGHSHTFFTANEKGLAGELAGVLKEAGEEVPSALMAFGLTTKKKEHALYGAHFKKDSDMKAMGAKKHIKFD